MAKSIHYTKQVRKVVRTIALGKRKIEVVRREYEEGLFTNDIMVDGNLHSPANGDSILEEMLERTQHMLLKGTYEEPWKMHHKSEGRQSPDLFYFDDLTQEAQLRAVDSILAEEKNAVTRGVVEAKTKLEGNLNQCVNDKYFIPRILGRAEHLSTLKQNPLKIIPYIRANLCEFHADGTYHRGYSQECSICGKR